jgi:hypothetical protein
MSAIRQRYLDEIRHLIEVEGFVAKDFFLAAPRAGRGRERARRRIAHLMAQCGFTAHDLAPPKVSELPASTAPTRKKTQARAEKAKRSWI